MHPGDMIRPLTLFLDWYAVWPGAVTYDEQCGAHYDEGPRGLRLAVQPARKSEIVLRGEYPWETMLGMACVLPDPAGGWKLWYGAYAFNETPFIDPVTGYADRKAVVNVCYAESDDGFHWCKPMLGLHEFNGSKENNIVLPNCIEASVFADPACGYRLVHHLPFPGPDGEPVHWLGTSTSPDGIRWTPDPRPLLRMYCDTQNIGLYDPARQAYTFCVRYARGNRRAMAIAEGPEPADLSHPQIVFEPDGQDPPWMDIYTNAYSRHPMAGDAPQADALDPMGRLVSIEQHWAQNAYLMFPSMYDRARDTLDVQLAISRDGRQWTRPERVPIIPLGEEGSGEESMIYPGPGIYEVEPGLWGVLYQGDTHRHNEWFQPAYTLGGGHLRWALWPENRLVALQADDEGECTLFLPAFTATDLRVNYQTERGGWIRFELSKNEGYCPPGPTHALPGYRFADCDPLSGDALNQTVSWRGKTDLSGLKDAGVEVVRVRMSRAKLFAMLS
ncbi:MAG: hypothetical protein ACYC6A_18760 [Armatimonadota bacterium]